MKFKKLLVSALGVVSMTTYSQFNYGEALQKSILFYEAQQSGELPDWNRVDWRADSALDDGSDVGIDLTGGWYDAGDHVKFNFPMAWSVTALAWGAIEYQEAYEASGQMDLIKRNLRFVTDYFIKCHTAPNEYYGQVGNGGLDHAFWGASEVMTMERPSYKIDAANPGSDLAAETAAALSAVSILLADDDPAYSATLLNHAEELYSFADNYRGEYSNSITDAAGFYRSFSSYNDEIVWGAAWLYRATGNTDYLEKAEAEYANLSTEIGASIKSYKFTSSWDDKAYSSYVLLSQLTGKDIYKEDAERYLDYWTVGLNGEMVNYSPGGQAHLIQWGSLRYAANTSFLAFVYSDKVIPGTTKASIYHDFAKGQTDYALGDNPLNRSYMVGFGNDPANNVHHRGAHGPWANDIGGRPDAASHTLYGALAGGPLAADDQFEDDRGDFIANEVACDYNACFTGNLIRLYSEYGGDPLTNFPVEETPSREELRSYSKFNSNNDFGSTVSIIFQNRTAWPARVTGNVTMRYFFDITEAVEEGLSIDDIGVSLSYTQSNTSLSINAWDAENNIYYAEISLEGNEVSPVGDPAFRSEVQIQITANNIPYDTSNDWSAINLSGVAIESTNIPVYENGVLVFGNEPDGGETPVASFTTSELSGLAPLEVEFNASASSDPNGDALTYAWDFGNGETSSLINPTIIFTEVGSYLVSLTVSDGVNTSVASTETVSVEEEPVEGGTIEGGPFAFTVGDGIADNVSGITLSGNEGETSQWLVTDDSRNILGLPPTPEAVDFDVAGEGTCFIYHLSYNGELSGLEAGNNLSILDGNFDLSNRIDVVREGVVIPGSANGGTIEGGPFAFTVGDGIVDNVSGITLSGNEGDNSQWVVTDDSRNILGLPPTPEAVDFDVAGEGTCFIYHLSYNGELSGLEAGNNLSILDGDFDLSNRIDVVRNLETVTPVGTSDCTFNTPLSTALPSTGNSAYKNIHVLGTGGPNMDNVTIFTINWDLSNNGLYQFSFNLNIAPWWTNFSDNAQNFNQANPSITLTGTSIAGLDGTYYAAVDGDNFVLVADDYAIYFSNSATAPDCDNADAKSILASDYVITTYPNPATEFVTVSVTALDGTVSGSDIVITNLLGQTIGTQKIKEGETSTQVDVSDYPSGLYLLTVYKESAKIKVDKIVIN